MIQVRNLAKTFVLHNQGGAVLPVLHDVVLAVDAGECVALDGPSGVGKSTLLRCIYGNYRADHGEIRVRHDGGEIDVAAADPRTVLAVRAHTIGYVSQFLREIPRVATLDVVAAPLIARGVDADAARRRAADLLDRLNLPSRLWHVAPATFSGGERQRVNLARAFTLDNPVMLLDEPTSALDAENRDAALALIAERVQAGAAMIGIFHEPETRARIAARLHPMQVTQARP